MKRLFLIAISAWLAGCSTSTTKPQDPAARSAPSASADASGFHLRPYTMQTLPNGMKILWIADNTLPYIDMRMMFRTGSSEDPVGKEGLAGFTTLMLQKGTSKHTALQLADNLEQYGSSFDADVQSDYTLVGISSLSFYKDQALNQFREIVTTPVFPITELERNRKLTLESLQKLADHPEQFSEYLMPHFLFGSHPYGHEASGRASAIRSLKKADLQNFYNEHFTPGNATLAVVGQFDDSFRKSVVDAFSGWNSKGVTAKAIPDFPHWNGLESLIVDRPDLNQAQIQIGFKGVPRNIPEYLDLRAALKILGESFGSRLFDEIRVKRGLTYHIRSWFDPRLNSGPMGIYTFTRVDKAGETVEQTLKTYRKFVQDGVSDKEVEIVKNLMRGQFPRTFETPNALALQLLILDRYGVGSDYLTNYYAHVDALSKDSINATIKKYFDPMNLRILVYAPRNKVEDSLKKLGKLEVKSYKEFLQ